MESHELILEINLHLAGMIGCEPTIIKLPPMIQQGPDWKHCCVPPCEIMVAAMKRMGATFPDPRRAQVDDWATGNPVHPGKSSMHLLFDHRPSQVSNGAICCGEDMTYEMPMIGNSNYIDAPGTRGFGLLNWREDEFRKKGGAIPVPMWFRCTR